MQTIEFMILGNPIAQQRHRYCKRGNFIHNYDPSAKDKANFLAKCLQFQTEAPKNSNIFVELRFYIKPPQTLKKSIKELISQETLFCNKRPDVDNFIKFTADSLNGYFWKDDGQIVQVLASKKYSFNPRTEIKIDYL